LKSNVKAIPVRDANGDELTLYEFQDWRYLSKVRRLKLCTGELVESVDEATFKIVGSGERLTRIADE
jgi:hypothetical protein